MNGALSFQWRSRHSVVGKRIDEVLFGRPIASFIFTWMQLILLYWLVLSKACGDDYAAGAKDLHRCCEAWRHKGHQGDAAGVLRTSDQPLPVVDTDLKKVRSFIELEVDDLEQGVRAIAECLRAPWRPANCCVGACDRKNGRRVRFKHESTSSHSSTGSPMTIEFP